MVSCSWVKTGKGSDGPPLTVFLRYKDINKLIVFSICIVEHMLDLNMHLAKFKILNYVLH